MAEAPKTIEEMFSAGAHFGLGRSRRNPSIRSYIFGVRNRTDIFDLEKTIPLLTAAKAFMAQLAKDGKTVLFVGGKKEASAALQAGAQAAGMPYVEGRWIGGTITNFPQIRRRIERYEKLVSDREKGELAKYTKRERMLLDKEIASLEKMFMGIVPMKKLPDALFVIDPRREKTAVAEAAHAKIPVVALSSSDCDIRVIAYPIVGNDASRTSIRFFMDEIVKSYRDGKKQAT
ncbi:MAG: 30S ribosomal protein S2 [Minisyncoccia bacterium]|jgi:small subunit ribosomal protein S2